MDIVRSLAVLVVACSMRAAPAGAQGGGALNPDVSTADLHRFASAWAAQVPGDTTCGALRPYWDAPSAGLEAYRSKFDVSFESLCRATRVRSERYAHLATLVPGFDSAALTIRALYQRFDQLHPLVGVPPVYFVVGNGISGGTTTRGRRPMILIGAEFTRDPSRLARAVIHELVHTQQDYPFWGSMTGGPVFLRGTVLRQAIMEGAADFLVELLTGEPIRNEFAETNEDAVWAAFGRDAGTKDYDRWLYNGANARARGTFPPDLGYWMGYRITKAYYQRAANKQQAVRDILTIRDFEAFWRTSGLHAP